MAGTPIFTPSRAHQIMYFALSGFCLVGGSAVSAFFMIGQNRTFSEVAPLLKGALLFAALWWLMGMIVARRRRRMMAAIQSHADTMDDMEAKLVNHV
jgi:uncharacterized membrane protein